MDKGGTSKQPGELNLLAEQLAENLRPARDNARLEEIRARSLEGDIELRKKYATGFFRLMVGLDIAVLLFLAAIGLNFLRLDKEVVMTLIGATVVQSGTITYFITKYLFPPPA